MYGFSDKLYSIILLVSSSSSVMWLRSVGESNCSVLTKGVLGAGGVSSIVAASSFVNGELNKEEVVVVVVVVVVVEVENVLSSGLC